MPVTLRPRRQTKHSTRRRIYCRVDDHDDARPVPRVLAILASGPDVRVCVCVCVWSAERPDAANDDEDSDRRRRRRAGFIRFAGRK